MIFTAETVMLPVFILNTVLILLDASLGYHLAPHLLRIAPQDEEREPLAFIRGIRRMLTGVVILYMFFNCLAYFRHNTALLMLVTALIVLDLGGQLYVRFRSRRQKKGEP